MEGKLDTKKLVTDLKKIVGESYVSDDIYDRVSYARDPMPYDIEEKNIPYVVVRPGIRSRDIEGDGVLE